jgi:hypothetical protein
MQPFIGIHQIYRAYGHKVDVFSFKLESHPTWVSNSYRNVNYVGRCSGCDATLTYVSYLEHEDSIRVYVGAIRIGLITPEEIDITPTIHVRAQQLICKRLGVLR